MIPRWLLRRSCCSQQRFSAVRPEGFSEAVLRIPSLLAGLGSIVMGARRLRRRSFSRAALILALPMAIHPWHVRYSTEARGYTMLISFLIAGIYFLLAALEEGRRRSWPVPCICGSVGRSSRAAGCAAAKALMEIAARQAKRYV